MKLHTRDQSREGEQEAQTPVAKWEPGRADYLQFLVDSQHVYSCFEELIASTEKLEPFRASGLERSEALLKDISWFAEEGVPTPDVGEPGTTYAAMIREMVAEERWQAFTCHFYNFYFAHTAGGRMIGKMMSDKLLESRTLDFYQWGDDPKEVLLPRLRGKIDALAGTWSREEKDACLDETANSFRFGGGLMTHISPPRA